MYQTAKYLAGLLIVGVVSVLATAPENGLHAADRCYANWSEASSVVRREALATAKDLQALVRARLSAKVVKITLCRSGSGYIYRLVVFEPGGKARNLTLDARRPAVR